MFLRGRVIPSQPLTRKEALAQNATVKPGVAPVSPHPVPLLMLYPYGCPPCTQKVQNTALHLVQQLVTDPSSIIRS